MVNDFKESSQYQETDYESVYLGGLDLLEYINGYKTIVFIDTIMTDGGEPGKVHHFSTENYRETLHLSCRHDLSFLDTLKLGKKLGFNLPSIIRIIAIEITEDLEIGTGLSKEFDELYPQIRLEVVNYINEIFKEMRTQI